MKTRSLTRSDPKSWLNTIWEALFAYREDCIPEQDTTYDELWGDICTAMAWISEQLDVDPFENESTP